MEASKPLPAAAIHILLALVERDCHGYGILQAVRERTGGRVRLGAGSLYRHLARLIGTDLVAEVEPPRACPDPRRGTHYRLTARGRRVLEAERRRLVELVASMDVLRSMPRKGSA